MSKKTALDDFQTVIPALRTVEAEMRISLVSGDAASWSTLDEALLYEERFVNLLYGTLVLPHRCRDCIDAHRPSIEWTRSSGRRLRASRIGAGRPP